MTTPIVQTLIDEQIAELGDVLKRPRETLVCELKCPVNGSWRQPPRDTSSFMEGDWGVDPRGRLVEL
ncbi:hypothetical protein V1687_17100 [Pseudomonas putida]|uniref:hypothetical protein n=1 Tax=Pseudomonas putida TaxID=303 RepID=UPI002ED1CCBF|nr:hypothetical protein V1687_17100 [Pseudomonas putida]